MCIRDRVSNALKFTPVDGKVNVRIKLMGEYDENLSRESNFKKVLVKSGTEFIETKAKAILGAPKKDDPKTSTESVVQIKENLNSNTSSSSNDIISTTSDEKKYDEKEDEGEEDNSDNDNDDTSMETQSIVSCLLYTSRCV